MNKMLVSVYVYVLYILSHVSKKCYLLWITVKDFKSLHFTVTLSTSFSSQSPPPTSNIAITQVKR